MKCPVCGNNASGNYCSKCGHCLMTEEEQFKKHLKRASQSVCECAKKIVGEDGPYSKIGKAAWAIAASHPRYAEYLNGSQRGSEKSHIIIEEITTMAVRIAGLMNQIRREYINEGYHMLRSTVLEKPNNGNDDPVQVAEDCREKHKPGIVPVITTFFLSIIGFLLGCVIGGLLRFFLG